MGHLGRARKQPTQQTRVLVQGAKPYSYKVGQSRGRKSVDAGPEVLRVQVANREVPRNYLNMKTYEDSSGKVFKTHAEAAASNVKSGNVQGASSNPNIVLSQTPTIGGVKGKTSTSYYSGSTPVSQEQYMANSAITSASLSSQADIGASLGNYTSGAGSVGTGAAGALASALSYGQQYTDTQGNVQTAQYDPNTGQPLTQKKDPSVPDYAGIASLMQTALGEAKPVDSAAIYAEQERAAGLQEKQQEVNNYQAQLNSIQAKAQADQLSVTGQGRGIPEVIIGGQQAQIAKEAAIQALPVAAQLSAAQGNLALAQQHVETMSKLLITDAQNKYDHQIKVIDAVIPFLTKQEEARAQAIKDQKAQDFSLLSNNVNFAQSLATAAFTNGQSQVGASIMRLLADPNSPTFQQDVAALAGQIQAKASGDGVPTVKSINGVDMQWNPTSGKWETIGGDTTNALSNAIAENKVDNINNILNSGGLDSAVGPNSLAKTNTGLWEAAKRFFSGAIAGGIAGAGAGAVFGGVGALPGAIIGAVTTGVINTLRGTKDELTGDRQNFIASTEQVRSELTVAKLAQAKGQGVTFGALSDGERGLIANAATKIGTWAIYEDGDREKSVLGYNIDEKSFKQEMDVINYFTKLDAILRGATPESLGIITQPDGTLWVSNSDGTFSQLKRQ